MTTAQAEIRKTNAFNPIWLIPIIAVVLGVWMVVHSWMSEGPEIQIAFNTAEGLEAGKTKIKYRNVVMGLVQEVILADDFEGVIAKVKLERQALPLLREDTRFWVVTARIGLSNVSGLDTLLSGAYIQLAPGTGEKGKKTFTGLEIPPLTPTGAPGLRLKLYAEQAGSVSTGDSVVYEGYKIGRVESMDFDPERRKVSYVIFIDAPFNDLIDDSVRFYNISGISINAGADGVTISTGSMDTILLGGITFSTPPGMPKGEPVEHNTEFKLYDSKAAANDNPFKHGTYYVVRFSQSLKGLKPGAPVEYRGIPFGRVKHIMMKEMFEDQTRKGLKAYGEPLPVLIYVEPGRLEFPDTEASVADLTQAISRGVTHGMRATLESGNILTGAKYISIDYYKNEPPTETGTWGEYTTIPTLPGGFDQIMVQVTALLEKLNALPLDQTVASVNSALEELDGTLAGLRQIVESQSTQDLPEELKVTMHKLQETLDGLSPDSPFYRNFNATLLQLNRTLGNMESLTRTLSSQPNAAIMPSKLPNDPIPEAKR